MKNNFIWTFLLHIILIIIKISDNTINLLKKEVLPALKISSPITQEDIDNIFTYLSDREVYLSQDIEDGITHDSSYIQSITTAVDEFNLQFPPHSRPKHPTSLIPTPILHYHLNAKLLNIKLH